MRQTFISTPRQALVKLAILAALAMATVAIAAFAFAKAGGEPASTCGLGKPASPPGQSEEGNGNSAAAMQHGQLCHE